MNVDLLIFALRYFQCDKQIRIISVFVHGYGPDMAISIQIRAGRIRETSRIKIREYGYAKSSKQIIFVGGVGYVPTAS